MGSGNEILIERQKKLGLAIKEARLSGMALNPGPSLRYLTGLEFHLSERPVIGIFTPSNPITLILPELEAMKAKGVGYEIEPITYGEDLSTWSQAIESGVKAAGLGDESIGVEPLTFRVMEMRYLQAAMPDGKIESAGEIMTSLRIQKDAHEAANMRKAADIAQKALQDALLKVEIGMTEREVAAEITAQLFKHGSDPTLPFPPIVSSGPNSANPHAFPSERKLANGDLLVIDWGASVDGYFSDITRTFAVGEVEEEYVKIHQTVQEANAAARAVVKPGVTCHEVDKAARDVIDKAGYGEYFIHRTGHGLGMEGHEEPYMRADNPMELKPGMTFTIEPGIYLPNRGGVRIEDDVMVTDDGIESLTGMPRELNFVG